MALISLWDFLEVEARIGGEGKMPGFPLVIGDARRIVRKYEVKKLGIADIGRFSVVRIVGHPQHARAADRRDPLAQASIKVFPVEGDEKVAILVDGRWQGVPVLGEVNRFNTRIGS